MAGTDPVKTQKGPQVCSVKSETGQDGGPFYAAFFHRLLGAAISSRHFFAGSLGAALFRAAFGIDNLFCRNLKSCQIQYTVYFTVRCFWFERYEEAGPWTGGRRRRARR